MELVIIVVVLAAIVWFFVFREKEAVKEASNPAPYKVEKDSTISVTQKVEVKEEPVQTAPIQEVKVEEPVAKLKKAAKPKAAKTAKPKAPKKPKLTIAE